MLITQKVETRSVVRMEESVAVNVSVNGANEATRCKVDRLVTEQLRGLPADALVTLREATGGSILIRLVERLAQNDLAAGIFEIVSDDRSAGAIANEAVDLLLELIGSKQPRALGVVRENRDADFMRSKYSIDRADEIEIDSDWGAYKADDSEDDPNPLVDRAYKAFLDQHQSAPVHRAPSHSVAVNAELDRLTRGLRHGERIRGLAAMDKALTLDRVPEAVEAAQRAFAGL